MKIVIAPDKFKGTLSAIEVCNAIREGILKADPAIEVELIPLSDGGEGLSEVLTSIFQGKQQEIFVQDPLFRRIKTSYGISKDDSCAFIEMSTASGLGLLKVSERSPMNTSTYGTGEMISHAIERGISKIILGIGGSATNDAGIGMAVALGFKFLDASGVELKPIGRNLIKIDSIIDSPLKKVLFDKEIKVACDVDIPLFGPDGAACLFAGQKGANAEDIELLDNGLRNFAKIIKKQYHIKLDDVKGAGAAGGMGAGAIVFLGSPLLNGIKLVLEIINFENRIKSADLIITGEGKIDKQTLRGKVIKGVVGMAIKNHIPVVAFCGQSELSDNEMKGSGLEEVCKLYDYQVDIKTAKNESYARLVELAYDYIKNGNKQLKKFPNC